MERFKIENFERENGPNSFPVFRSVAPGEVHSTLVMLTRLLGLPQTANAERVLESIELLSVSVSGINAEDDSFSLIGILDQLGYHAENVYLNWNRFENLDEVNVQLLSKFFTDFFYPSSDDLEIFPADLKWLVSIRHYGEVKALSLVKPKTSFVDDANAAELGEKW